MSGKNKKVTRIMKVTMDKDEFEKFDKGVTHSDSGVRNKSGKLSALPDIEPISDEDLPYRDNSDEEYVNPLELTAGGRAIKAVEEIAADVLSDPDVQESISELFKVFWDYKIKPAIDNTIQKIKHGKKSKKDSLTRSIKNTNSSAQSTCKYELVDKDNKKIVVSPEQAEQLIKMMQEEARRLSAMMYILSNIYVKNDKTNEEYCLEQSYIKQLVSDEANTTIRTLVANKQILNNETALCLEDWLNGYIRSGDKRIPVALMIEKAEQTNTSTTTET